LWSELFMSDTADTYRTERANILKVFRLAETTRDARFVPDVYEAFNKAAAFVENAPGIVEFYTSEEGATTGTDFIRSLREIVKNGVFPSLRARAIEAIGNITPRTLDSCQPLYMMQMLIHLASGAQHEDVAAAAAGAICRIGLSPGLRPVPNMSTSYFPCSSGSISYRSGYSGNRALGSDYIGYPEVAIAATAHILMKHHAAKARLAAAEELRKIAWEHRRDNEHGSQDLRSLVFSFVNEHKPCESDPQVMSVLEKTVGLDYHEAELEKTHEALEIANQLEARRQAAVTEQRLEATVVKETITVSKPLTFKKDAPPPQQQKKKRWWGLG
jgi:hypothetical protein